jgi:hypothetical protein
MQWSVGKFEDFETHFRLKGDAGWRLELPSTHTHGHINEYCTYFVTSKFTSLEKINNNMAVIQWVMVYQSLYT